MGKTMEEILAEARQKAKERMHMPTEKSDRTVPESATVPASLPTVPESRNESFSTESDFHPGEMLQDTYLVSSEAIRGGMGSVWRVQHLQWNAALAMKRPQAKWFAAQKDKDNFIRECTAWIELGLHPNIVTCFYVQEIDGVPTIFSEWMEGGSLGKHIRDGSLYVGTAQEQQERLLRITIDFARGLRYAHEHKLIHQDVKPDNVLLTADWQAKLSDFGLARALSKSTAFSVSSSVQNEEKTIYTPSGGYTLPYCSPEQLNGKLLNRRTDIFSWAVSVMEMYLGLRLWYSGNAAAAGCQSYFPQCRVAMPEPLRILLEQCMSEQSEDRPHDFSVIEEALLSMAPAVFGRAVSFPEPDVRELTLGNLNNRALSLLVLGKEKEARELWESVFEKGSSGDTLLDWNYALHLWNAGEIGNVELLRRIRFSAYSNGTDFDARMQDLEAYCESLCRMKWEEAIYSTEDRAERPLSEREAKENVAAFLLQYPAATGSLNAIGDTKWESIVPYEKGLSVLLSSEEIAIFSTAQNCFVRRVKAKHGWTAQLQHSAIAGDYLFVFLSDSLIVRQLPSLRCINTFPLPNQFGNESFVVPEERDCVELLTRKLSASPEFTSVKIRFGSGETEPGYELSQIRSLTQLEAERRHFIEIIDKAENLYRTKALWEALRYLREAEQVPGYAHDRRCLALRHALCSEAASADVTGLHRSAVIKLPYGLQGFRMLKDGTTLSFDNNGKWCMTHDAGGTFIEKRENWTGTADKTDILSAKSLYAMAVGESMLAFGAYENFRVVDRKSHAPLCAYHFENYYFSHTQQLFSPQERYLAMAGFIWNGVRTVFIAETGREKLLMRFDLPFQELVQMTFDRKEKWLFIGGSCGKALLVNLERKKVQELKPFSIPGLREESTNVCCCQFSEDGQRVYLAFNDYGTEESVARLGAGTLNFGGGVRKARRNVFVYDIHRKTVEPIPGDVHASQFFLFDHDRYMAYTCLATDPYQKSIFELHLMEMKTGRELYHESNPTGEIFEITGNSMSLATRSNDGLQFYDIRYEPHL